MKSNLDMKVTPNGIQTLANEPNCIKNEQRNHVEGYWKERTIQSHSEKW